MTRDELLITLAAQLLVLPDDQPRLVAVNGMTCVGKSLLVQDIAPILVGAGRPVLHVSYDDFHSPREVRHRRDRLSAEAYLEDSYDWRSLRRLVTDPLRRGERQIGTSSFDLASDEPSTAAPVAVPDRAVVIVDGEFLLSPDLADCWDLAVLLVAEPSAVLERALARDSDLGTPDQVREVYLRRYLAAWALHEDRHDPWSRADLVIDLTDPLEPRLLSGS